jgi:CHAD domain-containing protein
MLPNLTDDGLGVIEVADLPELDLSSTYYDTSDVRLARSGVTLRYRSGEDAGPGWTLKLRVPGLDSTQRDEFTFPGAPDSVPAEAADLVAALARSEPLRPVASLRTRRRRWMLCGDGDIPLAELVDDEVSVLDGDRVLARFRELELESRRPDLDELRPIAARLRRAGAVLAEPVAKAIRALGPRAAAPPDFADVPLTKTDPASQAVKAALAAGTRRLVLNDPATRLGDAEALHQMRVAARRLRSDLRAFGPLVDSAWAGGLRDELQWLGGLLGEVRDLDVQLEALKAIAADLLGDLSPLMVDMGERRDAARARLLQALRTDRYLILLDRLVDGIRDPLVTSNAGASCAEALPPLLADAWRRLRRRAQAVHSSDPDERYHAVRIAAKRVRYAAEAIAPAIGGRSGKAPKVADRAGDLQDLLGRLQDAVVAIREVERAREGQRANAAFQFAAGRLVERESAAKADARSRFPKEWARLERRYRRFA